MIVEHCLDGGVGIDAAVPVGIPVNTDSRESRRKRSRREHMLERDRHMAAVKIMHSARTHIDRAEGQPRLSGIDPREVDDAVERLVQGFNGIEPCSFDADWGMQTPGQITIWHEISNDTAENRHHLSGNIVTDQRKRSLSPNWLSLHAIPKLGNLIKSFARFVAGDDGAVDRAERAPALKHQYHLTWKRWCCLRAISHDVHPSSRVPPEGA